MCKEIRVRVSRTRLFFFFLSDECKTNVEDNKHALEISNYLRDMQLDISPYEEGIKRYTMKSIVNIFIALED